MTLRSFYQWLKKQKFYFDVVDVNDKIDYDFMRKYIEVQEKIVINKIMGEKKENLIKISELIRN